MRYPQKHNNIWEFPVHHMRGGTSTGLVIWDDIAPRQTELREELLRHLMGVPLTGEQPGNRQITGLGRGPATSNKVFFATLEQTDQGVRLVSTLAQLAAEHGRIDWSVNCGNMSSALQLWAIDTDQVTVSGAGAHTLEIFNTNTGVSTTSRVVTEADGQFSTTAIPGVMGHHPAVDLFLHNPVGAKTGTLLPTGNATDVIDGCRVSCVDIAVPMVIIRAEDMGKTGYEPMQALEADQPFMTRLKEIWTAAGLKMQLRHKDGRLLTADELAASETIPKVCIVAPARDGGDITVRYFTPQTGHNSMAVSGGCCLAAATLIPGSVAHEIAGKSVEAEASEQFIGIENPAGILGASVIARHTAGGIAIQQAAYQRSAQVLLQGYMPLYNASPALQKALADISQHTQ
ncbi:PrpF domain-containing protein [Pokkaliibacter sp. MBI-7]|uniref:PrpF domain-containing protein n=1 Tax=Pokkaliibacter sp. MBI-7 TaxID=3040600 RepID=UPI00244D4DE7|nr:PrpF domain-containing protein [Pokkaliibacter sp. MBI-7]MDH2435270.1 PrpF domain-containing protein [Pokkaliibacter sp. MBI-7]